MGICPFQILWAHAHRAIAHFEISGQGKDFSLMPYGMPYIFGILAGMGKKAFALFVNLQAWA